MNARILDGKAISETIRAEITVRVKKFVADHGFQPCLAAVLVGNDAGSQIYVRNKEQACAKVGMKSSLIRFPESVEVDELLSELNRLNSDPTVHGILVQLPLPKHVDTRKILDSVAPAKDVDAFAPENVGLLSQGRPRFLPCTPHGVVQILARSGIQCAGKHVVVVGRSEIVGKPMAMMMWQKDGPFGPMFANATVSLVHSQSIALESITRQADILIVAIGQAKAIKAEHVREGVVVIDVGMNRVDNGLCGDVDYEPVSKIASAITPVPGGVGPLTIAMLLENTLAAAEDQVQTQIARLPLL